MFYGVPPASSFPLEMKSDHFIIHYGMRNPYGGKGRGCEGVRDNTLVLTYLEALERLYDIMTEEPWSRPPPIVDVGKRTHVFAHDSGAYTADDPFADTSPEWLGRSVPFIVLPCRSDETTTQAELQRAAAEAVHEGTHVFNYTNRPYDSLTSRNWEWFDEAFAVFMETMVVAGNPDYIRFLMNWVDMPEVPLDHPSAKYLAGMFVRYLSKRLGNRWVNDVWVKSVEREDPLEAMQRLLPGGMTLVSPDPTVQDLFASGYCMDPYFLWDHESKGLATDVFARYGERAISESCVLRPGGKPWTVKREVLDHLACRYYRIYFKGNISQVTITLMMRNVGTAGPLKAEAAIVTAERRRKDLRTLQPVPTPQPGQNHQLSTTLDNLVADDVDHLVLVVANCGKRRDREDDRAHDDAIEFNLEVSS
ncbi:MAG TPA: DUF6055 domain-containing protein [Pyrinomonadaceae bacterium]|nr:DUF6055 domain-containing protein [Pyrinomonadaceae bacterium]